MLKTSFVEELTPGQAFYIISGEYADNGDQMAMTIDPKDKYAPNKTGIHNVYLEKWSGRSSPN